MKIPCVRKYFFWQEKSKRDMAHILNDVSDHDFEKRSRYCFLSCYKDNLNIE